MQYGFAPSMAFLISLAVAGCGQSGSMKLGNGAFAVKVPADVSFGCKILHHALNCNNYNIPNSTEGMDVRVCEAESKHSRFLLVTGKHPDNQPAGQDEGMYTGFAAGWSQCHEAKVGAGQENQVDGKKAMDYVLNTPLGDGATRVYVENGYSVMALAVPKYERSDEEISGFVNSLRPVAAK